MSSNPPKTNPDQTAELFQAGVSAAKSGQTEEARDLLLRVLESDERNTKAWLWLCRVVDNLDEKQICLENVLTIDPGNHFAQQGLHMLRQEKTQTQSEAAPLLADDTLPVVPPPHPAPPAAASEQTNTPSSPQNAEAETGKRIPPPTNEPPAPDIVSLLRTTVKERPILEEADSPLDDEYSCPYCAAPTRPDDKTCKNCRGDLWIIRPKLEQPSSSFKILFFLQILNMAGSLLQLGGAVVFLVSDNPPIELSLLAAVVILPLLVIVALYSIVLLVGLIKRWPFILYLYLGQVGMLLGVAGVAAAVMRPETTPVLVTGAITLFFLVIAQLFLIFNAGDDFTSDKERILLRLDPDIQLGAAMLTEGDRYAQKNMWALAALYFRQAARRLTDNLEPFLSLAVAYHNLKMYDSMIEPIERAQRIDPADPRAQKLAAVVEQQQQDELET